MLILLVFLFSLPLIIQFTLWLLCLLFYVLCYGKMILNKVTQL